MGRKLPRPGDTGFRESIFNVDAERELLDSGGEDEAEVGGSLTRDDNEGGLDDEERGELDSSVRQVSSKKRGRGRAPKFPRAKVKVRAEERAAFAPPAWAGDPSLLPKKPPGRS